MKRLLALILALTLCGCSKEEKKTGVGVDVDIDFSEDATKIEYEGKYTKELAGTTINVFNWGEYISDGSEDSYDTNAEFEKYCREELGRNVIRPAIAGLMGAYGAALYAKEMKKHENI